MLMAPSAMLTSFIQIRSVRAMRPAGVHGVWWRRVPGWAACALRAQWCAAETGPPIDN